MLHRPAPAPATGTRAVSPPAAPQAALFRMAAAVSIATATLWLAASAWAGPPRGNTEEEEAIGRQVVADVERHARLSEDSVAVAQLQRIADDLAPLTDRPLIHYQVNVVESDIPNAFSIPGGYIYFTSGLLKEARSEDELAGVMAHEIAHNTRQHALTRMNKGTTKALQWAELLSLGLLIFTGGGEWGQAAQLGVGALTQSVLADYSVEDEKDADEMGLRYILKSEYNPVGFLTFMEGMATLQNQYIEEHMGMFRTHPFSGDRVLRARRTLEKEGIPLWRRPVTGAAPPALARQAREGADSAWAVSVGDTLLYYVAEPDSSSEELDGNLKALDRILEREIPADEMEIVVGEDGGARLVADEVSVAFSERDAQANATSPYQLAGEVRERLEAMRLREKRRIGLLYYLIGTEREKRP